jgi:sensor histidine kinase YesM
LWLIIWFLSGKIAYRAQNVVSQMMVAMRKTGDAKWDYRVDIRTNDEFQALGEDYNQMQMKIESLLRRNEELANLKRTAEMRQLETQFNPHFIFNVLETLRYSILLDSHKSVEIIEALARLLKYSVYEDLQECTLADDIRYTKEYLKLHQFRFGDNLTYELDLPEVLERVSVPKMVLQPLVENGIKYGYKTKGRLHLTIRIRRKDDKVILQVTDDGGGVSRERCLEIEHWLEGEQMPAQNTGLYNLHRRIKLLYGEESGLRLNNEPGESFTVEIWLPYKISRKEN